MLAGTSRADATPPRLARREARNRMWLEACIATNEGAEFDKGETNACVYSLCISKVEVMSIYLSVVIYQHVQDLKRGGWRLFI